MKKAAFMLFLSIFLISPVCADQLKADAKSVENARIVLLSNLSDEDTARIRSTAEESISTIVLPSADSEAYDPTKLSEETKNEIIAEVVEDVRLSLIDEFSLQTPFYQNGFFFDMFAHVTLLRDRDFVPGATLSFGYRNGMSLYSLYGRFDYFLKPLGSETGRLATMEFNAEVGASFRYVVASQDWQELKIGVDLGYYTQWLEWSGNSSVFFLNYNGLMIRPTISVKANLLLFRIELGLYYQMGVYPRYEDYDGFGLYIKLF